MSEDIIYSNILSKVSCTTSADCPWWIQSAPGSPCGENGETIHGPYATEIEAQDAVDDYQPCGWTVAQSPCVDNECILGCGGGGSSC